MRASDGAGGFVEGWQVLGTLWAAMTAGTGQERASPGGPVSRLLWKVTVRGAPVGSASRPAAGQRFREGGRVFAILGVAESDPLGRYLICTAEEEAIQ